MAVCAVRQLTCKLASYSRVAALRSYNVSQINKSRCLSTTALRLLERKYSEKHEWVEVNGNIGTIGITDYAQEALGDIVYAQLPDVGTELSQDDECGALESVKAASELYSPISGTVVEINSTIEDQPGIINKKCYDEGWLFKLEMSKSSEVDELMDDDAYSSFLKQENN